MITTRQARELAQDVILSHGPQQAAEFMYELIMRTDDGTAEAFTEADWAKVSEQVRIQANRVWRLFGYEAK